VTAENVLLVLVCFVTVEHIVFNGM